MTTLKNIVFFLLFSLTIVLLAGCLRDILCFKCGESRMLGKVKFEDSTKNSYSNWTGTEILFFKDSMGNEQEYRVTQNKTINLKTQLTINTLCDSGWLDKQTEYYETESHNVRFVNVHTSALSFGLSLSTNSVGKKDSLILYDYFTASFKDAYMNMAIERDKPIKNLDNWIENFSPQFVADTTILGKNFKKVFYTKKGTNNGVIFFQKSKMIIGFKEGNETWLLDRIK